VDCYHKCRILYLVLIYSEGMFSNLLKGFKKVSAVVLVRAANVLFKLLITTKWDLPEKINERLLPTLVC